MNKKFPPESGRPAPTEQEIREHAYRLYEASGRVPGRDWENWFQAEAELRKRHAPPVPHKWQWHFRTLERIRDAMQRERDEHTRAARTPLPRGGVDAADIASDETEHERLFAEILLEENQLAEVEAALARLRAGTYGVCEATGEPIDAARLRAVPWARTNVPRPPPGKPPT